MCQICWKRAWRLRNNPVRNEKCKCCGKEFQTRFNKVFCSDNCKAKAYIHSEKRRHYQSSQIFKENAVKSQEKYKERNRDKIRERNKRYGKTPIGMAIKIVSAWKRRSKIKGFISKVNGRELLKVKTRDKLCVYCGKLKEEMSYDHIIPVNSGCKDEQNNLVYACGNCNYTKHTKSLEKWFTTPYCIKNNINAETINRIVKELLKRQKEQRSLEGDI